jgi:hypothetical protein
MSVAEASRWFSVVRKPADAKQRCVNKSTHE